MTYIYALVDPRTDRIRYIGKSDNPESRLKAHLKCDGDTHKDNWINQLIILNLEPRLFILGEIEDEEWQDAEVAMIRLFKEDLTNSTDGGEGMLNWVPSDNARRKMSEAAMGNKHSIGNKAFLGRQHSEETKRKLSERMSVVMRGNVPWNKGKPGIQKHSKETRAKISAALLGKKRGPYKRRSKSI